MACNAHEHAHTLGADDAEPFTCLVDRHCNLAEYVELTLLVGGVADANRRGALIAVEPPELNLGKAPLAPKAVHDLHLGNIAGDRTYNPVHERPRLLVQAGENQRPHRKDPVAQPAEAVVPIALASQRQTREYFRPWRGGMKSTSLTVPFSVMKSVSRISVSGR